MKTISITTTVTPTLALITWLLLPQTGQCYYNPSTGRWLTRDPIGESGGVNLQAFARNNPIDRVDRLGLDYYILIEAGTCGVNHRAMVGDDGEGKAYKIEIFPDVKRWYQEPRRLCGKGKLDWRPLAGPAVENTSGPDIIRIEKSVKTTAEQDKNLAANARALDGVAITYCLGLQDCRAVEKCTVAGRTLSQRIVDYLQKFVPPSWTPAPICPLP